MYICMLSPIGVQPVHQRICSVHRESQLTCTVYCCMLLQCTAAMSRAEHFKNICAEAFKNIVPFDITGNKYV